MSQPAAPGIDVHLQQPDGPIKVGTAFVTTRRGTVTTRFAYDASYLARSDAWAISPELPLEGGRATTTGLPGAMADTAPDRWGRNLIRKRLKAQERPVAGAPPTLTEVDFLLGVSDLTRQGALRYTRSGVDEFAAANPGVPTLIELPKLLNAADIVSRDTAQRDELAAIKALLDAGSASLGGARPKASVRDGDRLLIAKFPHHGDEWDVMSWEKTALDLAERCGISTPRRQLVDVSGRRVLLIERFDRNGAERIPYISAMTLLLGRDGESHDYVEVAEALTEHGGDVTNDLRQLWRRIAFHIAINNTDDHLRNHGLLRAAAGWVLSPAFDINPNPDPDAVRVTSINYTTDPSETMTALVEAAPYFALTADKAREIADDVRAGMIGWRAAATANGIAESEQRRFADVLPRG